MKPVLFITPLLIFVCCNYLQAGTAKTAYHDSSAQKNEIVITLKWKQAKPEPTLEHSPIDYVGEREWGTGKQSEENGTFTWVIAAGEPMYIKGMNFRNGKRYLLFVAEPGDNVTIFSNGTYLQFEGKGAEKYRLRYQVDSVLASLQQPRNRLDYFTESMDDYMEWYRYFNRQMESIVPLIDSYKNKLSDFAYHYIRVTFIDQVIDDRSDKFRSFLSYASKNSIPKESICAIYDSTYYRNTRKWFSYTSSRIFGNYKPIQFGVFRKYSFDNKSYPLNNSLARILLIYDSIINVYTGVIKEKFIAEFLPDELFGKFGFTPDTEKRLCDYYTTPGFPEYKALVKEREILQREILNKKNAPDFTLIDTKGNSFSKQNLAGKIAVFDFWFTGCPGCIEMTPSLKKVEDAFKNDTNIVFLSVSIDVGKEKWLKSIEQKKYTTGTGINLYTGGQSEKHEMITKYAITGYPSLRMIDAYGRVITTYPQPDPRKDSGKALINLLQKQLSQLKDGPYVMYGNDNIKAYYVNNTALSVKEIQPAAGASLFSHTDGNVTFGITLKKNLSPEPAEYPEVGKLLALSDIEGNFDALRKLLQENKVIDNQFNWIFGNGHLVFAGDMFDRGSQVTECLWMIYSLEEKAKAAGGYVHFILGNHEILSLYGDNNYAQPKYKDNAAMIGISLKDLYGESSELGRWLRTKNIIEKIGNLLFVHGGIAKEFTDSVSLSLPEVNETARRYYGQYINEWKHPDKNIRFLFSTSYSPFWFRTYYDDEDKRRMLGSDNSIKWTIEKPDMDEMDVILAKWKVTRIITGHTIVADTISVHYNGKVINTDTKHAEGKSEALLIEGNKYYRVNAEGRKTELFTSLGN